MIIEEKLGIPPDYQLKAIQSSNFFQKNWHRNKFNAIGEYCKSLTDLQNKVVLDIGTGSGNFELLFHSKFRKIYGIDYNPSAIKILNEQIKLKNIKNVETALVDIRKSIVHKVPSKLDLIVVIDIIEHIQSASALRLIKSLYNKLNPEGKIIIITPNYISSWIFIEKILDFFDFIPKFAGAQHITKYSAESLNRLFKSSNFTRIYSSSINTFGYLIPFESLCRSVNIFEYHSGFEYGNLIFSVFQKNLYNSD